MAEATPVDAVKKQQAGQDVYHVPRCPGCGQTYGVTAAGVQPCPLCGARIDVRAAQ